jgi:hypothetical protein
MPLAKSPSEFCQNKGYSQRGDDNSDDCISNQYIIFFSVANNSSSDYGSYIGSSVIVSLSL